LIALLDGVVSAVFADSLILEVGGVGYRVYAAPAVLSAAPAGERLKVFTHHVIREDLQALYGFRNPQELGFFGLLLTVTGVGPKVALAIIGSRPIGDLQLAILSDDLALLTAVSGVGKKLAARVVLELKEKVAAAGVSAGGVAGAAPSAGESEVMAALLALGYSAGEARQASHDVLADPKVGPGLEDRVKAALRTLLRGQGSASRS
jgi:Holliday junction DNA helicase RuvA